MNQARLGFLVMAALIAVAELRARAKEEEASPETASGCGRGSGSGSGQLPPQRGRLAAPKSTPMLRPERRRRRGDAAAAAGQAAKRRRSAEPGDLGDICKIDPTRLSDGQPGRSGQEAAATSRCTPCSRSTRSAITVSRCSPRGR